MNLESRYNPSEIESRIYENWENKGYLNPK